MPNKEVQRTLVDTGAQLEEVITLGPLPASGEKDEPLQREGEEGPPWAGKCRTGWVYG